LSAFLAGRFSEAGSGLNSKDFSINHEKTQAGLFPLKTAVSRFRNQAARPL
jgi:hypothetical protein